MNPYMKEIVDQIYGFFADKQEILKIENPSQNSANQPKILSLLSAFEKAGKTGKAAYDQILDEAGTVFLTADVKTTGAVTSKDIATIRDLGAHVCLIKLPKR